MSSSRRRWLIKSTVAGIITGAAIPSHSIAAAVDTTSTGTAFTTAAVGQEEYTNAITASRDTNISPKEAYDTILNKIPVSVVKNSGGRALDLGAGAGLSTQLLYEKGYHTIDAVDWSGDAWNTYVESSPETVTFYEMADAPFFKLHAERRLEKYDGEYCSSFFHWRNDGCGRCIHSFCRRMKLTLDVYFLSRCTMYY